MDDQRRKDEHVDDLRQFLLDQISSDGGTDASRDWLWELVYHEHSPMTTKWGTESCARCLTRPGETPWPCRTLRLLALPYADRPGFREEWRP